MAKIAMIVEYQVSQENRAAFDSGQVMTTGIKLSTGC